MNVKMLSVVACGLGAWMALAGNASAQSERLIDSALAAEILSGQLSTQAGGLLAGNTQLQGVYANRLLEQELVQEAARRGLPERFDVQEAMRKLRWQLLIRALREDVVRGIPIPKETEIKQAFEKEKTRWHFPEGYRLDVYSVPTTNTAAVGQLNLAVTAKKVDEKAMQTIGARKVGDSTSGVWIVKENMPPAVWEALPTMATNDLRVFKLDAETVLVKKVEYRKDRDMTYDEAKESVKMYILGGRADAAWETYLKRKLSDLGIQ